ncbi:MAG: HAMP domain-containing sensor histidine kinase [Bacteroidales bacterium]|nr:HAMP domain-containing sensor histidine kinase [Bacteroidales bacterium]MDD4673512.1 HAMP domain-containing sensor histidine kinase [Bacteroidales bacterium]MDY0348565.1 HAMP domain-containing sensor histidine kinase [Tenuifilaceae bacterium]
MKFKAIRLLTKTTFIYLIFISVAFFTTAIFVTRSTNNLLYEDTEVYFKHRERRLVSYIKDRDKDLDKVNGLVRVEGNTSILADNYPQYNDTIMELNQMDGPMLHRGKTILVDTSKGRFLYTMYKNINDFDKFHSVVLHTIVNTFVVLALMLTLFSIFLSGFLFRPFHQLLGLMSRYKIGDNIKLPKVKTSTSEFIKMQMLVQNMICRIEGDYKKLKEYTENMAHEMQTPLAIIRSKTEVFMADEELMNQYASAVKVIYDESTHLSNLGSTLNLLTKIENGEYNRVEDIKTYSIIQKHIETVKEMFDMKHIQLELDFDENHTLSLDPLLFDVMLKNLFKNALRYTPAKHHVRISTSNGNLSISNYGEPLSFDSSKIFNRFIRSQNDTTSLGLGLALVKKICDLNHLNITYDFADHHHTFTITPEES